KGRIPLSRFRRQNAFGWWRRDQLRQQFPFHSRRPELQILTKEAEKGEASASERSSAFAIAHEHGSFNERLCLWAERIKSRDRGLDCLIEVCARFCDAEQADERRFACCCIFAGGFADVGTRPFRVEQVVTDL